MIIAKALQKGKRSKGVQLLYDKMVDSIGTEYAILHHYNVFPDWVPSRIIGGILKVRKGQVVIEPGYDGIYGKVRLFTT